MSGVRPKIISLGMAVPEYSYSQREIFDALGYPSHFWSIFRDAGIEKRYFAVPLEKLTHLSWQEQQDNYLAEALILSQKAILLCLDGRDASEIGRVIYGTCTGFPPGPTLPHYLQKPMGFAPSTYYLNVSGQGCESGFPNLKTAEHFVLAEGKPALVINTELCSLTYFPEPKGKPDRENHYELLRAASIFGDASVACLVGFDGDPRHPYIIDSETYTDPRYLGDLGYVWRSGRLRVLLSRRVPEVAATLVKQAIAPLLVRNGLSILDIKHWIVHAAGNNVLDNIQKVLELPENCLDLSRETLRLFGNTSSTSVGITGKRVMKQDQYPNGYGIIISIGPGMTAGATLLNWI